MLNLCNSFQEFLFFLNLITILVGIYFLDISLILFITALFFFALAICVFLIEINISTKALRTHLEDLEDLDENY